LIASVAAMAVTAPAQAERGGHKGEAEAQAQANSDGGSKRAERAQARAQARTEVRAQARPERAFQARERRVEQRSFEPRVQVHQQASERRARAFEMRAAQPQFEPRAKVQETRNVERARSRALEQERVEQRHSLRARTIEQRQRVVSERMTARNLRQEQRQEQKLVSRQLKQDRRAERFATQRNFAVQPTIEQQRPLEIQRQSSWQDLSRRIERRDELRRDRRTALQLASIGQRVNPDWYEDFAPIRYQSYYDAGPNYYYRYDDDNGYLYQLQSGSNLVSALFPILGGAYSVGRPMPYYYDSTYNVPYGYSSLYYDTPDMYYRYGDGAIYGVNPTTQLITGIVALLTGQNFGIGQMLPQGYDAYNVPYAYRSSYYDTPDMWYRYDDGYIYGVDPYSRMIETSYPVYDGYWVGNEWPSYAGYGYDVPSYYDDLYYDAPGYDYRYASGGIYQVDPKTQLIAALVALVTGQNFNVGQRLPLGYDAYNVPFAYRDRYYDDDQYLYRYADGRILQVDPASMLIRRVIMV
jgi:hypothetical protein